MHRYILYIAVALLAFGIGSVIVYFYFYQPRQTVNNFPNLSKEEFSQTMIPKLDVKHFTFTEKKSLEEINF